jgi:hypothetical protein
MIAELGRQQADNKQTTTWSRTSSAFTIAVSSCDDQIAKDKYGWMAGGVEARSFLNHSFLDAATG